MSRWRRFQTEVPAKWILAGEHAVLRGGTAIAIPHPELKLALSFRAGFLMRGSEIFPTTRARSFWSCLQSVADQRSDEGRSFPMPEGELRGSKARFPSVRDWVPRAAISVAVARWLSEPLEPGGEAIYEFAKELEHRFHGRSSGMDVAVELVGKPISFVEEKWLPGPRDQETSPIHFSRHGPSRADVRMRLPRPDASRGKSASGHGNRRKNGPLPPDRRWKGWSVSTRGQKEAGLQKIAQGMQLAQECFYSWMLVPGEAHRIEESLLAQGALAVKMTGAGGGGFVVALWKD